MADIQLRFGKDVLVIGTPVQEQLANIAAFTDAELAEDTEGVESAADALENLAGVTFVDAAEAPAFDVELALLLEPEVFEDAYRLEKAVGAQCMVAPTANLTPARLAHVGMQRSAEQLARTAVEVTAAHAPEHLLVELAPCGLPLDAASKASLLENRAQYERAARLFDGLTFDAFFLNGFTSVTDLKCALMGIRKVTDVPVLASVDVDADGMLRPLEPGIHAPVVRERLEDAVAVMAEYGAQVAGFCTDAPPEAAASLAGRVTGAAFLPVLAQLFVRPCGPNAQGAGFPDVQKGRPKLDRARGDADVQKGRPKLHIEEVLQCASSDPMCNLERPFCTSDSRTSNLERPFCTSTFARPDDLFDAAEMLVGAGVQFVRAAGCATPACTGALAAAVAGRSVVGATAQTAADEGLPGSAALGMEPGQLAERLRASVNEALGIGGGA